MNLSQMVEAARAAHASDIHITEGARPLFRVHGVLRPAPFPEGEDCVTLVRGLLDKDQTEALLRCEDVDFAFAAAGGRQRVNVFRQQGALAATIRLLNSVIPSLESLGAPPVTQKLAEHPAGLILITGPTGSGKSTTLAAMLEHVNRTRSSHIITIEDPVEYLYTPKMALIHQREVGRDTPNFAAALRSALREDPDVILVGEMRDYETIAAAVTAAETGHLVLSTLHTMSAAQTVDRIIDSCPEGIQTQIRTQLSMILRGVITQKLLPLKDGSGRTMAAEVLIGTDAVLNLIRERKGHQLSAMMQSGGSVGMQTMNSDLARLVRRGIISREIAVANSLDKKDLEQFLM